MQVVKRCAKIVSSSDLIWGDLCETISRPTALVININPISICQNVHSLGILNVLNQSELSTEEIWNVKFSFMNYFVRGTKHAVFWGAI